MTQVTKVSIKRKSNSVFELEIFWGGGGLWSKSWYRWKYNIFFINDFKVQPRIKNETLQFWNGIKNYIWTTMN
jgi:hypothetical protein